MIVVLKGSHIANGPPPQNKSRLSTTFQALKQICTSPRRCAMERTETMITPTEFFGEAIKGLLYAAIGWFIATFNFQRRLDDFEKRNVAPIRADVAVMKGAMISFATREELKSEIA